MHGEGKSILCCCLLLACVGLVVSGIYLALSALDDKRARVIEEFQAGAENWSVQTRSQFDGLAVEVRANGTSWPLRLTTSESETRDQGTDVPQYSGLHYEAIGLPKVLVPTGWNAVPIVFTFNVTSATEESRFSVGSIPLSVRQLEHYNEKMCFMHQGVFNKALLQCTMFYQISSLCIKVRLENGRWLPDASGGSYSCQPGVARDWAPAQYKKIWHVRSHKETFSRPLPDGIDPAIVRVELRSVMDPIILAYGITGDSLVFPASNTELVVGGCWMVVGGVLVSLPTLRYFCRQRRQEHTDEAIRLRSAHEASCGRNDGICDRPSQQGIGRPATQL